MTLHRTFILKDKANTACLWAFLKANAASLAAQDKPLSVTVQEHKSKRSTDQNKLLWRVLNEIASSAWVGGKQYSAEAWHEQMKRQFIGCEELPSGELVGISTTKLDVAEFSQYIDKISAYAATDLGIELLL